MKRRTYLKVLIIISTVAVLSACSMNRTVADQNSDRSFTTQRNHAQAGRIYDDMGNIYISVLKETTYDRQKSPTHHGSIFLSDIEGDKLIKIADHYASFLMIHKDWLYFSSENLYRMPKEGGKIELLISGRNLEFTINKDKLYYADRIKEDGIYESNLDGSSANRIFEGGATDLTVHNDTIYVIRKSDYKLHAITIRDKKSSGVINDSVSQYCIGDEQVIYTGEGLYVQSLTEESKIKKIDDNVSTFNVYGEWIYYIGVCEGDMLKPVFYKVRRDGTEKIVLLDQDISFYDMEIYIAGNWVYLYNPYEADQYIRMNLDGKDLQVLYLGKYFKGETI